MGALLLEHNWGVVAKGECWNDGAALRPEEDGWSRCPDCGRSFATFSEYRAERFPLPDVVLGKAWSGGANARFVLSSGEVVAGDNLHGLICCPRNAVAIESRYPPT